MTSCDHHVCVPPRPEALHARCDPIPPDPVGRPARGCPHRAAEATASPRFDESPEADAEARADYYQEAAKTYYDGGKYEAAARMWEKVLAQSPDDQWAKFGLAKSLHMIGTPSEPPDG